MKASYLIAAAIFAALSFTTPSIAFAQAAPAASSELNQVARAQTKLAELTIYRGEVTGRMNRATQRAIETFQLRNNLEPTGTLTPETLSLLFHEA
jgi:peptidoglycan hydrolase-like protein with peptidoglycan-binding domain